MTEVVTVSKTTLHHNTIISEKPLQTCLMFTKLTRPQNVASVQKTPDYVVLIIICAFVHQ